MKKIENTEKAENVEKTENTKEVEEVKTSNKFSEMNIRKEIKSSIAKMGFEEPTPIQAEAIPIIMSGKDVIGIAQTGTGKTCAFGIPAIEKVDVKSDKIQVLILAPTRELVIQTCEEITHLASNMKGVKVAAIYGGQQIDRQIMALKRKPQIVVGTPGRVMDHMRRKTIKFDDINMFVLDEADEMLNMGFREDLNVILKNANEDRQTVLLSATMSKEILNITKRYQKKDIVKIEIAHKALTAPKISQYMIGVQEGKKIEVLSRILDAEEIKLAVIFCNTKRKVDELEEHLKTRGYQVDALHGDMKQSQRDIVMRRFRSGKTNILIATDVAARGIDVENIEVIFNYDIPTDEEYYVHRIGRTGRAGKEGEAITFVTGKEMYKLKNIERYTKVAIKTYEVPTAKFLNEKKLNNLLAKVTNEINANDLTEEETIISKYIEDTEVSALDVAAVLLKLRLGKTKAQEIEFSQSQQSGRGGKARLFITLGKKDNFKRGELKEFVSKESGVSRDDILDAEVLDKFSFVTVKEDIATKVIKKLNDTRYNGRRVAVELSTGKKG
ncbi:MAG: DEAD/DEAH box helicase [Clostridia bacterium]